ncbi:type II toxin-antitoxin system PemK/MazF family toxin [Spirosoma spitsbergense]|uniref:type II toxin-antitoxin system PemK/MazF family toxin n=1 Tax=Spirosoma spitsbergense TaxID=431554 RepID=UPI0003782D91|nr:type II toxin-antitoxin system PemK/MazF family toxin [Spirosoma spitsbergense]
MDRGTIVLTKFPFTDTKFYKKTTCYRIVREQSCRFRCIVAFISSVTPALPGTADYVLKTSHNDFNDTGLSKASVFKMDKLATLDKSIFTSELGQVSDTIYAELKNRLRLTLDLY